MIFENKYEYISFDALSSRLSLSKAYLKELIEKGLIPFLNVRGRLKFNIEDVKSSLSEIASNKQQS